MVSEVFDLNGRVQQVGDLLGQGGEGAVYTLRDRPDVAVKCFSPEKLEKHRLVLRQKIEAQMVLKSVMHQLPLSWPLLSIFNARQQWIGYAMRKAAGKPFTYLAHPVLIKKYFPNFTRLDIAQALIHLLKTVRTLHRHHIMLGDVNLNNFLCDPQTLEVSLIDCDSYQVKAQDGTHFPCLVGSPLLTAPEHLGCDFSKVIRTEQSDCFSLAVFIFQCLMFGRHPYDSIGGGDPVANMRGGHFPYGKGGVAPGFNGAVPNGPWYVIWSHLTYKLKDSMIRTFKEGVNDPAQRGSIDEWIDVLKGYIWSLKNGHVSSELQPKEAKKAAPVTP
jgi:DNA-binding helix-hairpin-helix protein with protein kinase domain